MATRKLLLTIILYFILLLFFMKVVRRLIITYKTGCFGNRNFGARCKNGYITDNYIVNWEADDPRLIEHVRQFYLREPAHRNVPYNLNDPSRRYWSLTYQSPIVEEYFQHKNNGFFVECGAYDGETLSNTLSLEVYLNWTGILIEPDFNNYEKLKQKNRKAWLVNACLHNESKPKQMLFHGSDFASSFSSNYYGTKMKIFFASFFTQTYIQRVWCFNLLTILLAVNRTSIDYLSLDIEGNELSVLHSFDWNRVNITLLQMEYYVYNPYINKELTIERKEAIRSFMRTRPEYREIELLYFDIMFAKS